MPASSQTVDSYAKSINITLTKNETERVAKRLDDMNQTYHLYFGSGGSLVQGWKVYGSIAVRWNMLSTTSFFFCLYVMF